MAKRDQNCGFDLQTHKRFSKRRNLRLNKSVKKSKCINIAEGFGRQTDKSFNHFLNIARGSLNEIETQLIIAKELDFVLDDNLFNEILFLIEEESKMINAFAKNLK